MTGIINNRIFAAASTTKQNTEKSITATVLKISSLRQRTTKVLLRNRKSCNVAEGLWSWKQEAENRNAEEVEQRCEAENVGMRKQRAGGD